MTDDDLISIREKRKRELLAKSLQKELEQKKHQTMKQEQLQRKQQASMIVNQVLEKEAIVYLNWLTQQNPDVAQRIRDTIILLLHKEMLIRPLKKIDLLRLKREITGEESKINIKRRGREAKELKEKWREEHLNGEKE
jgi:DNA-binding TFAR19-related protein (PDSD5 family)